MARADTVIVCLLPLAKIAVHSPTSSTRDSDCVHMPMQIVHQLMHNSVEHDFVFYVA